MTEAIAACWIAGAGFALIVGHCLLAWFTCAAREAGRLPEGNPPLPGWIIGTAERLMAFLIIASGFEVRDAGTIFLAWIGAKLAANWQRRDADKVDEEQSRIIRGRTLIALMASALSLGVAVLSGALTRYCACVSH